MAAKAQLDLITAFTNDIGMELGKKVSLSNNFIINDIGLNELECGQKYKYLDQDEDIGYDNVLNKDR